jgi:sugar O-acyltransferase (sialic acid O-acetyltransferase NeuD family)
MKIGLIGYGALGKQIEYLISTIYRNYEIIYFDDSAYKDNLSGSNLFNSYIDEKFSSLQFIVALGYKHLAIKNKIYKQLKNKNRQLLKCIHPSCLIAENAQIAEGVVLFPGCNVCTNTVIETGVVLYNGVIVAHDCIIRENAFLAPGVIVSGNVKIGKQTFIGAGSSVANNISIGNNTIIGIGSVVTKSVADNSSIIGNPMKISKNIIKLK